MMKKSYLIGSLILMLALLLGTTQGNSLGSGAAQNESYHLAASVIAGGGGSLQSGLYTLTSTIGQAEAAHLLPGSGQTLSGGFWHGAVTQIRIFLPLTMR